MQINGHLIILAACLWSTIAFSHNYETWEKAIKNSDITFFSQKSNAETINPGDLQGLLSLAEEVVKQRQDDIFQRKLRVYASIGLKVVPISGIGPIFGYILDQRTLGAIVGICSFVIGSASTLAVAANARDPILAVTSAIVGLSITTTTVVCCALLEYWFWKKERLSCDKLEQAYHDAVTIKTRLTALAAKNR